MGNINVFKTTNGYNLSKLILNENKTFIIGKVQDKNDKLNYISTKWEIDKVTKKCKCVLDDKDYDFSIKGVYIEGLNAEAPKVVKNFYTFKRDAWHCKLYKWVYGKEPHKVHPTMCPYFWIMVITLLPPVFSIILIIKMFGAGGTKFLEALTTYKQRSRQREIQRKEKIKEDWITKIRNSWEKMNFEQLEKLINSDEWCKWRYDLREDHSFQHHHDYIYERYWKLRDEKRELKIKKQHEQDLKRRAAEELKPKVIHNTTHAEKEKKEKKVKKPIEFNYESKTSKIIGIGLIIMSCGFALYYIGLGIVKTLVAIDWGAVGFGILIVLGIILGCIGVYFAVKYILMPIYEYIIVPFFEKALVPFCKWCCRMIVKGFENILVPFAKYCIWYPIKYCICKPFEYGIARPVVAGIEKMEDNSDSIANFFRAIGKGIRFILFLLSYPFVMLYKGFFYMVVFFKMCGNLIHAMYKKNCPRITWTSGDVNDEEYNNFIEYGDVDYGRLTDIANKIKFNDKLTEREMAIFVSKTGQINNLIK